VSSEWTERHIGDTDLDQARATAVQCAKELGRPDLADDASLVVGELVTNAMLHGGGCNGLETPPQHQVFRRWYIEELVRQLRAAAAGQRNPRLRPSTVASSPSSIASPPPNGRRRWRRDCIP